MSKDLELRVEVSYGDVTIERIIASKTTVRIDDVSIELTAEQVLQLDKALTAYVKADPPVGKVL